MKQYYMSYHKNTKGMIVEFIKESESSPNIFHGKFINNPFSQQSNNIEYNFSYKYVRRLNKQEVVLYKLLGKI